MKETTPKGAIAPAATFIPEEARLLQSRVEAATGISDPTRKWLIALAMLLDLRQYVPMTVSKLRDAGYPIKDRDTELLDAINDVEKVLNKYLSDQIRMSILGFGDDNVCDTNRI